MNNYFQPHFINIQSPPHTPPPSTRHPNLLIIKEKRPSGEARKVTFFKLNNSN